MADDLIPRLLEAIEQDRKRAEAARGAHVDLSTTAASADHVTSWSPKRVLALCQAHREIVEEYQKARAYADNLLANRAHGATYLEADGFARGLLNSVRSLARAYRVEEQP